MSVPTVSPNGAPPSRTVGSPSPSLEISNAIVGLLRTHAGRGPTRARAFIGGDLVVVALRDCLTTGEKTLVDRGNVDLVLQTRGALQTAIQKPATEAVEAITGRQVVAYLPSHQIDPDHAAIVFILERESDA